jgi:hypothetical protein
MVPKLGKAWPVAAGWFDYNNDGLLDLFVVNYLNYNIRNATPCVQQGHPAYCSPVDFLGTPNILYRNNGDGTFTDASEPSHISQYIGKGMGLAFADYDNDGFADVFVSNDTFENYLFHNNGDGTFADVALRAGVAYNAFGNAIAGMGVDFRDIDNDGRADIFETPCSEKVFRSTGTWETVNFRTSLQLLVSRPRPVGRRHGESVYPISTMTVTRTCSPPTQTSSTIPWSWRTGHLRSPIGCFGTREIRTLRM